MSNEIGTDYYRNLSLDDLITLAIDNVTKKGEDCTFERLVYECFTLFPKSFSFFRYSQWPDSNKLDRPLRKLRERGLIIGNPKIGFSLTEFGQKTADEVRRGLGRHRAIHKSATRSSKGKETNLIAYLKASDPYKRFKQDKDSFALSEAELINLLRGTLETPPRVLKQNLSYYMQMAIACGETELQEFLSECEKSIKTSPDS